MIIFAIFTAVIALSCSVITIKTLVGYSNFSLFTKALVTIIVTFSWFAPILSMAIKRSIPNVPGAMALSQGLYMLFGLAFILLMILLARDIIWYILFYTKKINVPDPKDITWLNKANLMAVILSVVIFSYAIYEGMREPRIKEVDLVSSKVNGEFTMALVTDIHIDQDTNDKTIKSLVERINELNPDVVLFVGDMVDGPVKFLGEKVDILKGLTPKYGTYFTSGNHELYSGFHFWVSKFDSLGDGFRFIDNTGIHIEDKNVFLFGVPDTRILRVFPAYAPDFDISVVSQTKGDEYKVVLSHAPDAALSMPEGLFDLQLSGHTHGGQIFPFHILAKTENKFLAGLYDVNGMKLYVSRGAGYWGPPLRFLAPSEITFIKITN